MRQHRFDLIVSFASLALLGYFAWHAERGPRGIHYRDKLVAQVAQLENRFSQIDGQRQQIEHKASLMRPDSIDPDMLDELARAKLEMTGPNDFVVLSGSNISQPNP